MKPYYSNDGIEIYLGDSRAVLPSLKTKFSSIITDPVWPNVPAALKETWSVEDPFQLMRDCAVHFPKLAETVVLILGCDSDPRFLNAIPSTLPFIRHSFIEYRVPSMCGRVLKGHECVYAFGNIPAKMPGKLLPGRYMEKAWHVKENRHPCPRNLQLMKWIVKWFGSDGPVLDPFMGSGTTLLAAKTFGIPAVGIEQSKEYVKIAIDRLQQMGEFEFGVV